MDTVAATTVAGEASLAEGHVETKGVVQNETQHAERRANAEKAMREAMKADAKPEEDHSQGAAIEAADSSTPAEAPRGAGNLSDDEKPSKPETPDAKAERAARIQKFLASKSEKGETQQLKARLAQLEEATKSQLEQARAEARREVLEQMQRAPKELFQTHGVKADDLLAAAMEEATLDPVKLLERKYAVLEQRLQQEAQERARLQQSLQEREQHAVVSQQQQAAIAEATNAERFPALAARYGEDHNALLSEMSKVANDYHARAGHWPTYADVAEFLDEREQSIFARYSKGSHAGRPGLAAPKPAKMGTGLTAADTTSTTGAAESKAMSHEERLRRARASEAMTRRNAERGR